MKSKALDDHVLEAARATYFRLRILQEAMGKSAAPAKHMDLMLGTSSYVRELAEWIKERTVGKQ